MIGKRTRKTEAAAVEAEPAEDQAAEACSHPAALVTSPPRRRSGRATDAERIRVTPRPAKGGQVLRPLSPPLSRKPRSSLRRPGRRHSGSSLRPRPAKA